jgi:trimeric autotransporter adhesin
MSSVCHFQSWPAKGSRVFDVTVAGTKITNLDVFSLIGGKNAAYTTTLTVTTTGPTLTIAMAASTDKVTISAIEIHAVVPVPTAKSPTKAPVAPTKTPAVVPTKSPVIAAPTPTAVTNGPLYIDCGASSSSTDSQNRLWLADQYFDALSGVFNTTSAIANTLEDKLYQTERTGVTVGYNIPRPSGTYAVTLHFAEI